MQAHLPSALWQDACPECIEMYAHAGLLVWRAPPQRLRQIPIAWNLVQSTLRRYWRKNINLIQTYSWGDILNKQASFCTAPDRKENTDKINTADTLSGYRCMQKVFSCMYVNRCFLTARISYSDKSWFSSLRVMNVWPMNNADSSSANVNSNKERGNFGEFIPNISCQFKVPRGWKTSRLLPVGVPYLTYRSPICR